MIFDFTSKRFSAAVLPIALLIISAVLALIGGDLARSGPDQIEKILAYSACALAIFHIVFFLCRHVSIEASIKASDFVFLLFAATAIFGILEPQSSMQILRLKELTQDHYIRNDGTLVCEAESKEWVKHDPEPDSDPNLTRVVYCMFDKMVADASRRDYYNHSDMIFALQNYLRFKNEIRVEARDKRFEEAKELAIFMNENVFKYRIYENADFYISKLFSFYLLCIGLAINLAKVSADVLGWKSRSLGAEVRRAGDQ